MEDVLEVYHRPHVPDRPAVCLDETSKQLIAETRVPIPAKPGHPKRYDYEYQRNGTANLFMMFAPLEGWRHVEVTDRHTAVDYAQILKDLSDKHVTGAKPRACGSIRLGGRGSGRDLAGTERCADREFGADCRGNPRTLHRALCRSWRGRGRHRDSRGHDRCVFQR